MAARTSRIAKISPPDSSGALPRKRLFRLLDACRRKPVVWVSGPAGSGKTTLISSYLADRKLPCLWYQVDQGDAELPTFFYYLGLAAKGLARGRRSPLPHLTPEYLQTISVFARRTFEELFCRLAPPFALVFDNYQEVPEPSPFHDIMHLFLELLPEGINVIIISRSDSPSVFARLRANSKFALLGWHEIRFTINESRAFLRERGVGAIRQEKVERIHRKTEGWAAGLLLMAGALTVSLIGTQWDISTPQEIFDYFVRVVFDETEPVTRKFLMMTSFLPCITVQAARKLTENVSAHSILSFLSRRHYFIERRPLPEPVYQYHPLFREFLLARARDTLSSVQLREIRRRAAAVLAEEGRSEFAAALFAEAEDWDGLSGLIVGTAKSLVEQGRTKPLQEWVACIPREIMEKRPWLLYWLGVCRLPFDPAESRRHLEKAFGQFKTGPDAAGAFLSWAAIADSFIYELGDFSSADRWISEIQILLGRYPQFPAPEIEAKVTYSVFCMLMFRQPDHPDLPRWEEKLKRIALSSTDLRLRVIISAHLVLYYTWWTGAQAKAASLIETVGPAVNPARIDPLAHIVWRAFEAAHNWMTANNEACLSSVGVGLQTAEKAGIHIWDFVLLAQATWAMTGYNLELIRDHLRRLEFVTSTGRRVDIFYYHYLLGWESLCVGELGRAHEHMRAALSMVEETGIAAPFGPAFTRMGLAEVLIESGRYEEAGRHLRTARQMGRKMKSKTVECQYLWIEALLCLKRGENEAALDNLRSHLAISRECGILNHPCWRSPVMASLYARALEAGIEVDHVRHLIRKHDLVPAYRGAADDNWPYPIKIYTLGGFRILRGDEPVEFAGKVQQKPLMMLKALIALGSQDVSEKDLCDVLWPDSDGDSAHKSHEVTLLRLRRLLGIEDAIQLRGGLVSIDSRHCRVDVLAFDSMADDLLKVLAAEPVEAGAGWVGRAEKAVEMYRGHFLPAEADQAWTISLREKIRRKVLHLISSLGRYWKDAGQFEMAIVLFQRGLEIDDLAEEFYQQLMICHEKLGRRAEAARVYQRCRSVFSSGLGIVPSDLTEAIYARIKRPCY